MERKKGIQIPTRRVSRIDFQSVRSLSCLPPSDRPLPLEIDREGERRSGTENGGKERSRSGEHSRAFELSLSNWPVSDSERDTNKGRDVARVVRFNWRLVCTSVANAPLSRLDGMADRLVELGGVDFRDSVRVYAGRVRGRASKRNNCDGGERSGPK